MRRHALFGGLLVGKLATFARRCTDGEAATELKEQVIAVANTFFKSEEGPEDMDQW